MAIALNLVKSGFYNGNLENVFNSRVDYVLHTYHYEMFTREYEATLHKLNEGNKNG